VQNIGFRLVPSHNYLKWMLDKEAYFAVTAAKFSTVSTSFTNKKTASKLNRYGSIYFFSGMI
ncbi:MAG: hypothetical protein AMS26_09790, partial [Bacteroides sp. SM23_62]